MGFPKRTGAILICLAAAAASKAQAPSSAPAADDPDRQRAFQLYGQHKMPEAVPLLETVTDRYPTDTAAHEALGVALVSLAATENSPTAAKADRLHARRELLRARELGDTSDLSRIMLAGIPENGETAQLSAKPEVDAALREGEAAFSRADWAGAIAAYSRAWQQDSSSRLAALYLGDTYYRVKDMERAGEWYAKAIQVDPNQEVTYRYWGDALLAQGKIREARAKYIEGIAADPYRATSLAGLHKWLLETSLALKKPPVTLPAAPSVAANGKTTISVDPDIPGKNGAAGAWLMYSLERTLWRKGKFQSEYPGEGAYRHSLKEESSALTAVIDTYRDLSGKDPSQRDDSLERLVKLGDEGLLEAFVLLVHADSQIVQDFPAYRDAHRDKLIEYLDEYVVPPAP
jgi:tetratricopeptide (TPR) repeat protein